MKKLLLVVAILLWTCVCDASQLTSKKKEEKEEKTSVRFSPFKVERRIELPCEKEKKNREIEITLPCRPTEFVQVCPRLIQLPVNHTRGAECPFGGVAIVCRDRGRNSGCRECAEKREEDLEDLEDLEEELDEEGHRRRKKVQRVVVCNGAPGNSTCPVITPIPPGPICPAGGVVIGCVVPGTPPHIICNGTQGKNGAPGAVPTLDPLPVGSTECPTGGVNITSGSQSEAVCNGQQGPCANITVVTNNSAICKGGPAIVVQCGINTAPKITCLPNTTMTPTTNGSCSSLVPFASGRDLCSLSTNSSICLIDFGAGLQSGPVPGSVTFGQGGRPLVIDSNVGETQTEAAFIVPTAGAVASLVIQVQALYPPLFGTGPNATIHAVIFQAPLGSSMFTFLTGTDVTLEPIVFASDIIQIVTVSAPNLMASFAPDTQLVLVLYLDSNLTSSDNFVDITVSGGAIITTSGTGCSGGGVIGPRGPPGPAGRNGTCPANCSSSATSVCPTSRPVPAGVCDNGGIVFGCNSTTSKTPPLTFNTTLLCPFCAVVDPPAFEACPDGLTTVFVMCTPAPPANSSFTRYCGCAAVPTTCSDSTPGVALTCVSSTSNVICNGRNGTPGEPGEPGAPGTQGPTGPCVNVSVVTHSSSCPANGSAIVVQCGSGAAPKLTCLPPSNSGGVGACGGLVPFSSGVVQTQGQEANIAPNQPVTLENANPVVIGVFADGASVNIIAGTIQVGTGRPLAFTDTGIPETAFVASSAGFISDLAVQFTGTTAQTLITTNVTVHAEIWFAPLGQNNFMPVPGTDLALSPSLLVSSSGPSGAFVVSGSLDNIHAAFAINTRLVLVTWISSSGGSLDGAAVTGTVSGGMTVLLNSTGCGTVGPAGPPGPCVNVSVVTHSSSCPANGSAIVVQCGSGAAPKLTCLPPPSTSGLGSCGGVIPFASGSSQLTSAIVSNFLPSGVVAVVADGAVTPVGAPNIVFNSNRRPFLLINQNTASDENIEAQTAFITPTAAVISAVSAQYQQTGQLSTIPDDATTSMLNATIHAEIWSAPLGEVFFTVVPGTTVTLSPVLTAGTLGPAGTGLASGSTDNINVVIPANTQLIMLFWISTANGTSAEASGWANGGMTLLLNGTGCGSSSGLVGPVGPAGPAGPCVNVSVVTHSSSCPDNGSAIVVQCGSGAAPKLSCLPPSNSGLGSCGGIIPFASGLSLVVPTTISNVAAIPAVSIIADGAATLVLPPNIVYDSNLRPILLINQAVGSDIGIQAQTAFITSSAAVISAVSAQFQQTTQLATVPSEATTSMVNATVHAEIWSAPLGEVFFTLVPGTTVVLSPVLTAGPLGPAGSNVPSGSKENINAVIPADTQLIMLFWISTAPGTNATSIGYANGGMTLLLNGTGCGSSSGLVGPQGPIGATGPAPTLVSFPVGSPQCQSGCVQITSGAETTTVFNGANGTCPSCTNTGGQAIGFHAGFTNALEDGVITLTININLGVTNTFPLVFQTNNAALGQYINPPGSFDNATAVYTVPTTGTYSVSAVMQINPLVAIIGSLSLGGNPLVLQLVRTSSSFSGPVVVGQAGVSVLSNLGGIADVIIGGSTMVIAEDLQLLKNDQLLLQLFSGGFATVSVTLLGDQVSSYFSAHLI